MIHSPTDGPPPRSARARGDSGAGRAAGKPAGPGKASSCRGARVWVRSPNPTRLRLFAGRTSTEMGYAVESPILVTQNLEIARSGARGRRPETCRLRARLLRGPSPPGQRPRLARPTPARGAPTQGPGRAEAGRSARIRSGPRAGGEEQGPRYLGDARRCRCRAPWRPGPDPTPRPPLLRASASPTSASAFPAGARTHTSPSSIREGAVSPLSLDSARRLGRDCWKTNEQPGRRGLSNESGAGGGPCVPAGRSYGGRAARAVGMCLLLGAAGAGKSLLVKRLQKLSSQDGKGDLGDPPSTRPTVGTNLTDIVAPRRITIRELGGCMGPIWPSYYGNCRSLLLVSKLGVFLLCTALPAASVSVIFLVSKPALRSLRAAPGPALCRTAGRGTGPDPLQ
ncbi:ADP-ribosylation factor-like protein 16 isoform X3 [Myotis myotis]|uniref:ADP-ribosylation factor-like protein 16 isoform X3 n=1 Tax=Myotis myotis TaxID=51298 RepID=UPI00174EC760|nr:ADP-ribosylation factor-like protein 16 isoform X3 [Myotis myotis]